MTGNEDMVGVASKLPFSAVAEVEGPAKLAAETSIEGGGACRRKGSARPERLVKDDDFEEPSL